MKTNMNHQPRKNNALYLLRYYNSSLISFRLEAIRDVGEVKLGESSSDKDGSSLAVSTSFALLHLCWDLCSLGQILVHLTKNKAGSVWNIIS